MLRLGKGLLVFLMVILSCQVFAWLEYHEKGQEAESEESEKKADAEPAQSKQDIDQKSSWKPDNQTIQRQRQYRAQVQNEWGRSREASAGQIVFYEDDFKSRISVDFAKNNVRITMPRIKNKRNVYDLKAERNLATSKLENLLSLKQHELISLLADELLVNPSLLKKASEESSPLVFQELFGAGKVTDEKLKRTVFKMMKKAGIRVFDQSSSVPSNVEEKVTYDVSLPEKRLLLAAKRYLDQVAIYSEQNKVPPSLVYAIIHTESHFNPIAKSAVPAFGLMQIVPSTAGTDAVRKVFSKKPPRLSPQYLFVPENNIRLGAAYLHVLYYRYLRNVQNEQSRAYIAVAAYNAGPSNVARAFVSVPRMSEAIPVINDLSSDEVRNRLLSAAPAKETRNYLRKVLERERFYRRHLKHWNPAKS